MAHPAGISPNSASSGTRHTNTTAMLLIWDIAKRHVVETRGPTRGFNNPSDTAWSSDDRYLGAPRGVGNQPLLVYDRTTGHALPAGRTVPSCVNSWTEWTAWSRDASLLAATTFCGDLRPVNPATGRIVYRAGGLGQRVSATSFSPDGTQLILAGATTPGSAP